jgi:trehalose synthase
MPQEVEITPRDPQRFRSVLPTDRFEEFAQGAASARELLGDSVVWNVNSTARGGGVVELLRPLVAYARGAGVDVRWAVIDGSPGFFEVTKRIHNHLHGTLGDGGRLDDEARHVYEETLAANAAWFAEHVRDDDVVIVHDPQPAGLVPALHSVGAAVVWRCHVGVDHPNELVREAWSFLLPYLEPADAYVFSRDAFVWEGIDRGRVAIIAPTIDVFTPKNVDIEADTVEAILRVTGLIAGDAPRPVSFERQDGTQGYVERRATIVEERPLPSDAPVLVQVSRWDALKDPRGVIRGFAEHVPDNTGAHLVYAGPAVEAVADDPEGARVLRESIALCSQLPAETRSRVHLATLPMDDLDENAFIVNALQRHATVIAQKSLAEGFGLTVAEAMWKARPVVASRVGGIQEQISHGESGVLLDDPLDLEAFGGAVTALLREPRWADQLGRNARERVRERFLSARSLLDYAEVIRRVLRTRTAPASRI